MVGVGEKVKLTFSPGSASWTTSGGKLSPNSGSTVIFTAPDRTASIDIKAIGGGCSASINFQVIEPNGVRMEKASRIAHNSNVPSVGFKADIYLTPDTVSFENIEISEDDCVGIVTGYFVGTWLDGVHHLGHGAGNWVPVGPVTVGKGSKIIGQDEVNLDLGNNAKTPYSAGTFDWPIPWEFRVGSGASKVFTTVHQRFTIDASGDMTASKGGASAASSLNDPSSSYGP